MNSQIIALLTILGFPIYWVLYRFGLLYSKKIKLAQIVNIKVGSKRHAELWFPIAFTLFSILLITNVPLLLAIPSIVFLLFLTPAMATDIEDYILPDWFTYPAAILAIILSLLFPQLHGESSMLWGGVQSLVGITAGFALMYGLAYGAYYMYGKEAVGGGDLKLMAAIGGLLGWLSPLYILCAGAIIGSILAIITRKGRRNHIPFGPSIMLAFGTWFLGGKQFMENLLGTLKSIINFILS